MSDGSPIPALKEWAVVVRALLAGEQLLDVRKGGLREEHRRFELESNRMWLYPTTEHQRPELLKPAYRRWLDDDDGARVGQPITISGWADVVGVARIESPDELARLDAKFVWTLDYAESRLHWKRREPLWVLALRAWQLDEPISVAWRDEYAGCTSWVDLEGLPDDPGTLPAEPALSDESFTARMKLIENDLPGRFEAPARRPA